MVIWLLILMLCPTYRGFGGHETVINNLARGLNNLGHKVVIGSFSTTNIPSDFESVNLKRLEKLISDRLFVDFDLIHSHKTLLNYFSLATKTPFVFHYHGASTTLQKINLKISTRICRRRISKVISISQSALDRFKKITGNTASEIPSDVVYNGVDTTFFHTNLSKLYIKGSPQLLFVGHLYPHKNVICLIESMNQILKAYPNAHLQIIGCGEDYPKLKGVVIQRGLERNVDVLGNVSFDELKHRYSSCDIYVSASLWEEFGLPAVEAMACGKPVLLSDIPAHRELVEASNAGLIFSLADNSAIIKGIKKIYENPVPYQHVARVFAEQLDWSAVCKRISDIYVKCAQDNDGVLQ